MNNGTSKEVISQFDAISELPDYWDHNRHYQKYLLKHITRKVDVALDIGCGTGEFTKVLSRYSSRTLGLDVSPSMIEEARKRNRASNIEFMNRDIERFLIESDVTFDLVVSIATFHHLDMRKILRLLKDRLNEKGVILILDLYKPQSVYEYFLSLVAAVCNPLLYLIKRRSLRNTREEREVWREHAKYDTYDTISDIKTTAKDVLGKVRLRRLLFWRYLLVYEND